VNGKDVGEILIAEGLAMPFVCEPPPARSSKPCPKQHNWCGAHGLRASELCDLQWSQVELATGRLHVRRAKNGSPSVHPMQGDEIRALRRLQREQGLSSHVFMSERDGPMTPKAFHALFGRVGSRAKMQFLIHPHMLRHGCGYALANAGHDTRALQAWLGHRNIQHTVRYTELAPDRFKNFWR
jgi:integrase